GLKAARMTYSMSWALASFLACSDTSLSLRCGRKSRRAFWAAAVAFLSSSSSPALRAAEETRATLRARAASAARRKVVRLMLCPPVDASRCLSGPAGRGRLTTVGSVAVAEDGVAVVAGGVELLHHLGHLLLVLGLDGVVEVLGGGLHVVVEALPVLGVL